MAILAFLVLLKLKCNIQHLNNNFLKVSLYTKKNDSKNSNIKSRSSDQMSSKYFF